MSMRHSLNQRQSEPSVALAKGRQSIALVAAVLALTATSLPTARAEVLRDSASNPEFYGDGGVVDQHFNPQQPAASSVFQAIVVVGNGERLASVVLPVGKASADGTLNGGSWPEVRFGLWVSPLGDLNLTNMVDPAWASHWLATNQLLSSTTLPNTNVLGVDVYLLRFDPLPNPPTLDQGKPYAVVPVAFDDAPTTPVVLGCFANTNAVAGGAVADLRFELGQPPVSVTEFLGFDYLAARIETAPATVVVPGLTWRREGESLLISCSSEAAHVYRLQTNPDLSVAAWTDLEGQPGTGAALTWTNTLTGGYRVFRVKVEQASSD